MGVENGKIPDRNMQSIGTPKVNTPGSNYTGASQARLNNLPSVNGAGAWIPSKLRDLYDEPCLIIHFNKLERVKEVITQGHPTRKMYAKEFRLYYSGGSGMVFQGMVGISK